jgi:hypothetical protein
MKLWFEGWNVNARGGAGSRQPVAAVVPPCAINDLATDLWPADSAAQVFRET